MNRYAQLFSRLDKANQGAFVPFVMLGDPTPNCPWPSSMPWSKGRRRPGARDSLLRSGGGRPHHSGVPPCVPLPATPPRTTASACSPASAPSTRSSPIGLLVCANLVYVRTSTASTKCQRAGVDSVLVADVPVQMCAPTRRRPTSSVSTASLSPPNGDAETLKQVAELGSGYTYLVSRAGDRCRDQGRHAGGWPQAVVKIIETHHRTRHI